MLVLERRLDPLEFLWLILQVVNPEAPASRADYSHGIIDVRCVDALAHVDAHDGVGRARVPELDRLVPRPGHQSLQKDTSA